MSHGNDGWASPIPAGLLSLVVACLLFYALLSGQVTSPGALPIMGFWLLGAFVIQVSVALIELKTGAYNGGNVFLVFSSFFCLTTGLSMFFKYYAALSKLPIDTRVDGWAFLGILVCLIPITIAYLKKSPLSFNLLVIALVISLALLTGLDLKILDHIYARYCAWGFLVSAFFAFWTMAAMFLNTNFEKTIIPMGPPMIK